MVRLFAALALPPMIRQALQTRQAGIDGARWRPPDSLHVTLRFFGEIRPDVARDLDAALLEIRGEPFDIVLEGAGAFGDGADIHATWAGVTETGALRRLAEACDSAARRAGLKPEKRRFRPHVTLAYLRHADPVQVAAWIQAHNLLRSPAIPVESFGLYSSTLGGEGSHYRLEAEYPLG